MVSPLNILRKKIIFFPILGGGARRVRPPPPLDPPLICIFSLFAMQLDFVIFKESLRVSYLIKGRNSHCLIIHKLYQQWIKVAKCTPYLQCFQVQMYPFCIFTLNNAIYMMGVPSLHQLTPRCTIYFCNLYLKEKI